MLQSDRNQRPFARRPRERADPSSRHSGQDPRSQPLDSEPRSYVISPPTSPVRSQTLDSEPRSYAIFPRTSPVVSTRPGDGRGTSYVVRRPDRHAPKPSQSSSDEDSNSTAIQEKQRGPHRTSVDDGSSYMFKSRPLESEPGAPSESSLSTLGQQFAGIPEFEYAEAWKFLKSNERNLNFNEKQLWQAAYRHLRKGDERSARRCIQQSVVLKRWHTVADKNRYLAKLKGEDRPVMRDLLAEFDRFFEKLRDESLASHDNSETRNFAAAPQSQSRRTIEAGDKKMTSNESQARTTGLPTSRTSSAMATSNPDPRYKTQRSSFFVIGKVLAAIFYEAAHKIGEENSPEWSRASVSSMNSGTSVCGFARRMVVVKVGHGYSLTVPINTYSDRGLTKRGLNQKDIDGHAIIHLESVPPKQLPDEPSSVKRPLSMRPAPGQRLKPASRINFAKIYTIEHNSKVMDIGMISSGSMHDLRQYFRQQVEAS